MQGLKIAKNGKCKKRKTQFSVFLHCQPYNVYTRLPSNRRRTTREYVYLVTCVYPVFALFDAMTLLYEFYLDILKMTKNELSRCILLNVRART